MQLIRPTFLQLERLKRVLLALICASSMVFAFDKQATAEQSTPFKKVKWRLYTIEVWGKPEVEFFKHIAEDVGRQTNGNFIIEIFPGSSLGFTEADVLRVMKQDGVEMAHSFNSRVAGDEPLATVSEIPFLATRPEDVVTVNKAVRPMWDKILAKWNGKLLVNWSSYLAPLTATRKVTTVDGWKGLKIRTQSDTMSKVIQLMGAVPVAISFAEAYSATATRIVEGHFWSPGTVYNMKIYELCHYMNFWDPMAFGSSLVVNTNAFNGLPEKYQDALISATRKWEDWLWDNEFWAVKEDIEKLRKTGRVEMVEVGEDQKRKAAEIVSPVYEDWLKKAGPDGSKWLNVCLKAVGKSPRR